VLSAFLSDLFLTALLLLLCFSVPKAYETKQALCDKYIALARDKVSPQPSKSAAHRDKSRAWNVSKQKWNLC
jgi:hypothetical protein